ncbi:hypothetical protein O1611_g6233 [Lasiodiplodia mahajangana]|uniref:Uncharacterized protein n=1 Tax=Lasiodiplodia mahajangana TaxID=1108764 RepID=A0ACC2JJL9_9PEZI|nr:hypothetical protein O1611_g6233 [Lasiodiplodia mahajangana]
MPQPSLFAMSQFIVRRADTNEDVLYDFLIERYNMRKVTVRYDSSGRWAVRLPHRKTEEEIDSIKKFLREETARRAEKYKKEFAEQMKQAEEYRNSLAHIDRTELTEEQKYKLLGLTPPKPQHPTTEPPKEQTVVKDKSFTDSNWNHNERTPSPKRPVPQYPTTTPPKEQTVVKNKPLTNSNWNCNERTPLSKRPVPQKEPFVKGKPLTDSSFPYRNRNEIAPLPKQPVPQRPTTTLPEEQIDVDDEALSECSTLCGDYDETAPSLE